MGSGKRNRHAQHSNSSNSQSRNNNNGSSSSKEKVEDDEDESLDFCQRFFGDPLFSNLNVALLFLFATFLPMLVWIPHFVSEYRRLRHIQLLEEERQMRMQRARLATQQHQPQPKLDDSDILIWQDYDSSAAMYPLYSLNSKTTLAQEYSRPLTADQAAEAAPRPDSEARRDPEAATVPVLCPDGITVGYDDWFALRDAIAEANAMAAEDFLRWNEYVVLEQDKHKSGQLAAPPTFQTPEPFVICPGVTLTQSPARRWLFPWSQPRPRRTKQAPLFINAEDITIECDMCTIDVPGTHLSFGPHAKNVLVRGITFRGATASSLIFHHHGSDATFEDCYWLQNSGGVVHSRSSDVMGGIHNGGAIVSTTTSGAVADLNSTSTVTFFRCVIDDQKQNPKRATVGAGVANVPGMNPPAGHLGGGVPPQNNVGVSSSLTIRN